jgi:hypothetical protein
MANFSQGLIRGLGGALGAAERGLVRISDAEEKRLGRLGKKEEAQTQRDFLMNEAGLTRGLTREQNRLSRELTKSEGVLNRAAQLKQIDAQADATKKAAGGTQKELTEARLRLSSNLDKDKMNLAQSFSVINQDDAQAFQKEQKDLDRSLQEELQSDRIQAQTDLQKLKGSQTTEQMIEAQKNYVTNAEQSLLHSQQLETYVLNARDAKEILREKRVAAQNVLNDARAYQYTAKEAELKFGYTLKGLEKQVELAITAEGRANKEWGRRVKITQKAEIDKLERIAELEDTYKEKWSKIETAAAQNAQKKANALAFAKAVYDNAYSSIKQLEKIRAELDKEDENYAANAKQLDTYIKKYHAEVVKPAETRYQRWSGIEVLYPGSYELNTSDESVAQEAINLDEDRTVAVMEGVYNLRDRDSTQFRHLPEKILTAISQATLHILDLSGDEAALRMSFLPKGKLKDKAAENDYLKEAYPKIFEDADGKYTDENLNSMVVSALKRIAEEGAEFRKVQPRAEEKGGPQTPLVEPGMPLPATQMGSPSEPFTPKISPETDPATVLKESQSATISTYTKEEAETRLKQIRNLEANKGYAIEGEHLRALRFEKAMLMERLNELRKAPAQETGMINGPEDRGLLAQAGDVAATVGEALLPAMAQASDQPPALPEKGVIDGTDVYIWAATGLDGEEMKPDEADVMNSPGFRLRNPLSIKFSQNNDWEGSERNAQTSPLTFDDDPEFERFESPEMGYRAAAIIVDKYRQRGNTTAEGIITEWLGGNLQNGVPVPPEEGSLESYLNVVSQVTGGEIQADTEINTSDTLKKLFLGMSVMEMGGVVYDQPLSLIEEGIYMSERWNDDAVEAPTLGSGEIPRLPTGPEAQFTGGINNYPHDGLIGRY